MYTRICYDLFTCARALGHKRVGSRSTWINWLVRKLQGSKALDHWEKHLVPALVHKLSRSQKWWKNMDKVLDQAFLSLWLWYPLISFDPFSLSSRGFVLFIWGQCSFVSGKGAASEKWILGFRATLPLQDCTKAEEIRRLKGKVEAAQQQAGHGWPLHFFFAHFVPRKDRASHHILLNNAHRRT